MSLSTKKGKDYRLESSHGDIGSSTQKIQLSAPGVSINAEDGGAFVQASGSLQTLSCFAENDLAITGNEAIEVTSILLRQPATSLFNLTVVQ